MRIPHTINLNTLQTYNQNNNNANRVLQADNFTDWDRNIPQSLHDICIETIANNWQENPLIDEITLLADRCLLFEILSVDLPLSLTVPKIKNDIYWKRCFMTRWPNKLPVDVNNDFYVNEIVKTSSRRQSTERKPSVQEPKSSTARSWKECFVEMYTTEYLEKLKPEDYQAEMMKELADLCRGYIKNLAIREMQCAETSPHRIPLNSILSGFTNLTELSICFKQTYSGPNFSWNIVKVAEQDVKLLAKGLEKCNLKIFRLTNSDIDDQKVLVLLKSLQNHENLATLDFSHCKIKSRGAIGFGKFLTVRPVQELVLSNNKIDEMGVKALCYGICHPDSKIKSLDLRLNAIKTEGAKHLIEAQLCGGKIKSLFLSACGLKELPVGEMIRANSMLSILDLSNNALGEEIGQEILKSLSYNTNLVELDLRLCGLDPATEFAIIGKVEQNRQQLKKCNKSHDKPTIIGPSREFVIDDELRSQIDNIFDEVL